MKHCFLLTKKENRPSILHKKLVLFFKEASTTKAVEALEKRKLEEVVELPRSVEEYTKIYSEEFNEFFGDWMNADENFVNKGQLDENGEPRLHINKSLNQAYFLNNKGEKFYVYDRPLATFDKELQSFLPEVINAMVADIAINQIDLINSDFSVIEIENLSELFDKVLEQSELDEDIKYYLRLFKKDFVDKIQQNLNDLNLVITDEFDTLENNDEFADSNLNLKESIKKNFKENASRNIKLLLNFAIPSFNQDGTPKKSLLGQQVYEGFGATYARLLPLLANQVPSFTQVRDDQGNVIDTIIESRFDKIYKIILNESKYDKSLLYLTDLLKQLPVYKQEQFSQAFALKKELFKEDLVKLESDGISYQNVSSISNKASTIFYNKWLDGFKNKFIDIVTNQENVQSFVFKNNNLPKITKYNTNMSDETIVNGMVNYLQNLGIDETYEDLKNALIKYADVYGELLDSVYENFELYQKTFDTYVKNPSLLTDRNQNLVHPFKGDKKNKAKGEKFFNEFAEIFASLKPEFNNHSVNLASGKGYEFTAQSNLSLMVELLKNQDAALEANMNLPFYNKNYFYKALQEGTIPINIKISRFNRLKVDNSNGVDNNSQTLLDAMFASLHRTVLHNLPNMMANADKASMYFLEGVGYQGDVLDGNVVTPNSVPIDTIYNLFLGELERISHELSVKDTIEDNKKVVYYHYTPSKEGAAYTKESKSGNAYKLIVFDYLLEDLKELNLIETDSEGNITKVEIKDAYESEIKQRIADRFTVKVDEAINEVRLAGLNEDRISKELKAQGRDFNQIVASWYITNYINNLESTLFLNGDPAYYKNKVDFLKRIPAAYVDGLSIDVANENERYFNAAVVDKIEVGALEYTEEMLEAIAESTGESITSVKAQFDKEGSTYTSNNIADAQAWSSIKRWEFLMKKTYGISPEVQAIVNKLKNNREITVTERNTLFKTITLQPVKGVFFQVVNGVPVYLKYSLMPIAPSVFNNSGLGVLAQKMQEKNIDEVITIDGVKVGASGITKINDGENIINDFTLNPIQLDNRFWKLQQQLRAKTIKTGALGSQIQKNIFANFDFSNQENINKALEVLQAVNNLMDYQRESFFDELGLTKNESGDYNFSDVTTENLISMLKGSITDSSLLDSLLKGVNPMSSPVLKKEFESVLASKFKNAFTKLKIKQAQFIQVSNFGTNKLNKQNKSGIKWLVEEDKLKMPKFVKETLEDGSTRNYVKPGQILIPHSQIVKYIPNYQSLSVEKLKSKIDEKLLRAIGYRIPNQGMMSIDALEIVGVLPPEAGDTIIVYTGLTTKTGSDFDIDKMFMFFPEITSDNPEYNDFKESLKSKTKDELLELYYTSLSKSEKLSNSFDRSLLDYSKQEIRDLLLDEKAFDLNNITQVDQNEDSIDGARNRLFESYWNIITAPSNYMELTSSIDEPTSQVSKSLDDPRFNEKDVFDPWFQLDYKNKLKLGKAGLGFVANHLVSHKMSQLFELFYDAMNENTALNLIPDTTGTKAFLGLVKNKDGFKIDQILSGYMNLFVDIAKDPKIAVSNYTLNNLSTAMALIRFGVSDKFVSKLLKSPILKELSRIESIRSSEIVKSFEIDIETELAKIFGSNISKNEKNPIYALPSLQEIFEKNNSVKKYITYNKDLEIYDVNIDESIFENDSNDAQVLIYYAFKEFKITFAKDVTAVNKATKIDTDGYGRFESGKAVFLNALIKALSSRIGNVDKLFNTTNEQMPSFVGIKAFHELFTTTNISKKLFTTSDFNFLAFLSTVQKSLGLDNTNDPESLQWIANSVYGKHVSASPLFQEDDLNRLFSTNKNKVEKPLITRLLNLKNALEKRGINNFFLERLYYKNDSGFAFLRITSGVSKDPVYSKMLKDAWLDMYTGSGFESFTEQQQEGIKKLAIDIAKHSFYNSKFAGGIDTIYDLIPDEMILDKFNNESHNEYMINPSTVNNLLTLDTITEIIQNNSENVKSVSTKTVESVLQNLADIKNVKLTNVETKGVVINKTGELFLKTNNFLYKLVGVVEDNFKNKLFLYEPINKLGFNKQGSKIFELNNPSKSIIELNNSFDNGETLVPIEQIAQNQRVKQQNLLNKLGFYNYDYDVARSMFSDLYYSYLNQYIGLKNMFNGTQTQAEYVREHINPEFESFLNPFAKITKQGFLNVESDSISRPPVKKTTTTTVQPSTNIKQGVAELFESNPELASEVYEAMGFKEKIKERNNAFTETINNIESSKTGEQVSLHKIFPHISEAFVTKTKENKYYVEHTEDLFTKEELENYLLDNFKPTEKETDVRYLGITSQQKQEAQQAYSNYLDSLNTTELYSKLGDKTESNNVKVVKSIFTNKDNKDVITAFRVDKKLGLLDSFKQYNAIGNPINWQDFKSRFEGDNATIAFMDWFLGKDYTNLEQEYRQEILNNLDNLKGNPIEYYKELGRPSHATALDYLINQLGGKQDIQGFREFVGKPTATIQATKESALQSYENYVNYANSLGATNVLSAEDYNGLKLAGMLDTHITNLENC